MVLRDGLATMSMTGELAATPLPGVDPTKVEYLHLLPNLAGVRASRLRDDAPDGAARA